MGGGVRWQPYRPPQSFNDRQTDLLEAFEGSVRMLLFLLIRHCFLLARLFDPHSPPLSSALRRSAHPAHQRDSPAAPPALSDHANRKYICNGKIIKPESSSLLFLVSHFPWESEPTE
ncbi:hypothetical protein PFLUV_G00246590 [Perca fluviatilis]|uniref:Uncharacterized protein n=1 Tax=Perca fluviatilis TaxID=8168 RepID=A0A6A5EDY4_PERFL|nr:hypothetical protein PFLUV_G00246590 [Perca fluviatilis]